MPHLTAPKHVPLVVTTRGDHVECVHYGSVAVVDEHGKLVAGVGEPQALHFTRSALKPLQALPFVEDDGVARLGLTSHELALMCASHNGEQIHVNVARNLLARIGATEADLQCGSHAPYYFAATGTPSGGGKYSAIFHNCSGKHGGFMAYCRLHGHRLQSYLDIESPVQVRIRNAVQQYADGGPVGVGIDGCSCPNYALPLTRLAMIFQQLAAGATPALAAVAYAMKRHPDLVAGTGRIDTALMQVGADDWVCKIGADGVQAIGVASKGWGLAVRVADGNARALAAATVELLRQLGLVQDTANTPLATFDRPPVRNLRGVPVGRVQPVFKLPKFSA
jgi:L-asparaginase II